MTRIARPFLSVLLCAPIAAQVTQRVSVSSSGVPGNADSYFLAISEDGRYVAFNSVAHNLVAGDTNGAWDVFVRDRRTGSTERVSLDSNGMQVYGSSGYYIPPSISADGRYVAFCSLASTLVPGDTNGAWDTFVRDRQTGTTERVSVNSLGREGNANSGGGSISADGRFVAFGSLADNLVPGDTNQTEDVFVHDRVSGITKRVSVDSGGFQGNDASYLGQISADGRFVVFDSLATNLVAQDTNHFADVFVHDLRSGSTERVSIDSHGGQAQPTFSDEFSCAISDDGRYVAFWSDAENLVPGDANGLPDVFVHDRQTFVTEMVSVSSNGSQQQFDCCYDGLDCSISGDGRCVAFTTNAANLVPGDANGITGFDVFVHDRQTGATEQVSLSSGGLAGNDRSKSSAISADGRYVAFTSSATNLIPGDTNGGWDVFVHDRIGGTKLTNRCDPGVGGVLACPCSNPPSGLERGCDNSSATGGAVLSASGGAFVSSDSLVFTTSDEKPSALSILMQGNATIPGGVVYGQGVRCLGGTVIRRLYIKQASGGSIAAPDFGVGDSTVSARSAAKGDLIQSGQSRWYLVLYRDTVVLGGCPASSTFNATQTGLVSWAP